MSKKIARIRVSEEYINDGWQWFIFFPVRTVHVCTSNRYYSSRNRCLRSAKNFCERLNFKYIIEEN
jgi:hypothetical protein